MQIESIRYPEGVELSGWTKVVFERRLQGVFSGYSFGIYELEKCRKVIKGDESKSSVSDDLSEQSSADDDKVLTPTEN